jgi:hypothetical protein
VRQPQRGDHRLGEPAGLRVSPTAPSESAGSPDRAPVAQ